MPPARNLPEPPSARRIVSYSQIQGLPFARVEAEGRDQFRADLDAIELIYLAQVPATMKVCLSKPRESTPAASADEAETPRAVEVLITHPHFIWRTIPIQQPVGRMEYACAAGRVWTLTENQSPREEWLFMRQEMDGGLSFALSNAPANTALEQLAEWHNQAYLNEQTIRLLRGRAEKTRANGTPG